MKSFIAAIVAAILAYASAGIAPAAIAVAPAPLYLAAAPGVHASYAVSPLALPHPVLSAAPAGLVLKPALLQPVVKSVVYAQPVVKAIHAPVAYAAAPVAYAAAPVAYAGHHHHY